MRLMAEEPVCAHSYHFMQNLQVALLFAATSAQNGNSLYLQTLCALVSHDDVKQRWLQSTGILALLQRLTMQDSPNPEAVPIAAHPILASLGENTPLGIWRQSARIIAMISTHAASQSMIRSVHTTAAVYLLTVNFWRSAFNLQHSCLLLHAHVRHTQILPFTCRH